MGRPCLQEKKFRKLHQRAWIQPSRSRKLVLTVKHQHKINKGRCWGDIFSWGGEDVWKALMDLFPNIGLSELRLRSKSLYVDASWTFFEDYKSTKLSSFLSGAGATEAGDVCFFFPCCECLKCISTNTHKRPNCCFKW